MEVGEDKSGGVQWRRMWNWYINRFDTPGFANSVSGIRERRLHQVSFHGRWAMSVFIESPVFDVSVGNNLYSNTAIPSSNLNAPIFLEGPLFYHSLHPFVYSLLFTNPCFASISSTFAN
jgi:hypothetical protein